MNWFIDYITRIILGARSCKYKYEGISLGREKGRATLLLRFVLMTVMNIFCSTGSAIVLTLGSVNVAIAQGETAAEANIYQEFGWLVLALVLGYGVIARRGSRTESQEEAATQVPTTSDAALRPAAERSLRLIDMPGKPAQDNAVEGPAVAAPMPTPKKTA